MAYRVSTARTVHLTNKSNAKACEICGTAPANHLERTTRGEHSNRNIESGMVASVRSNRIRLAAHRYPERVAAMYQLSGLYAWAGKLACDRCAETYGAPFDRYYNG